MLALSNVTLFSSALVVTTKRWSGLTARVWLPVGCAAFVKRAFFKIAWVAVAAGARKAQAAGGDQNKTFHRPLLIPNFDVHTPSK